MRYTVKLKVSFKKNRVLFYSNLNKNTQRWKRKQTNVQLHPHTYPSPTATAETEPPSLK